MKPAVPDPPELHWALWHDFDGDVAWDIGANCGQTLPHLTAVYQTVIAFEPATECHDWLNDFLDVTVLPIALSDTDANVDLIALPDKIDTGQLVTAGTHGMEWNPDSPDAVVRTVKCRTVDSLIDRREVLAPDFMKIDVEGHEGKILFGARKTLATIQPDMLIEFHSEQLFEHIYDLLECYDYKTTVVRHPHYTPNSTLWLSHGWIRATK